MSPANVAAVIRNGGTVHHGRAVPAPARTVAPVAPARRGVVLRVLRGSRR